MYVTHQKEEIVIHVRGKQQSAPAHRPCNGIARLFGFVCLGTNACQRHGQLGSVPSAPASSTGCGSCPDTGSRTNNCTDPHH